MAILRRSLLVGAAAVTAAIPLRYARAAVPPYNFATLAASAQNKILGGNITQVPPFVTGAPATSYQFGWMFQNWTTGQNVWVNWVQRQIANLKLRITRADVRLIMAADAVFGGALSQSAMNNAVGTFLTEIRAQGMTASLVGMAGASIASLGSPSTSDIWTITKSVLDNVVVPSYLDTVSCIEPGIQEAQGGDVAWNNTVCGLMKSAGYATPVVASAVNSGAAPDFSGYTPANLDAVEMHLYPEQLSQSISWATAQQNFYSALTTIDKPFLIGETGVGFGSNGHGLGVTDQDRADWLEYFLYVVFGHPSCLGYRPWGGQSDGTTSADNVDGNWGLWKAPAPYSSTAFNPATVWADTTAAWVLERWGSRNRNNVYPLTLNASTTITGTNTKVNMKGVTPIQEHVISPDQDLGTKTRANYTTSCVGTFSLTGDAGATYRISYSLSYFLLSSIVEIGHVDIVGSGSGTINVSGTMTAGDVTPQIMVQRVSGPAVNGTLTACAVTITFGNAPARTPPVSLVVR